MSNPGAAMYAAPFGGGGGNDPSAAAAALAAQQHAYAAQHQAQAALQQHLRTFWAGQAAEMDATTDFKNHNLPLARIKKIMKSDEDVRMISSEAPALFAKACEMFILEARAFRRRRAALAALPQCALRRWLRGVRRACRARRKPYPKNAHALTARPRRS
jgi:hypothetical protein